MKADHGSKGSVIQNYISAGPGAEDARNGEVYTPGIQGASDVTVTSEAPWIPGV
jgi:hypothetical protein